MGRFIRGKTAESFYKGLLRGFFGGDRVLKEAQGEAVYPVLVNFQQPGKSGIIPRQAAAHQFRFGFTHYR